jgi:hypothetical protein
VVTKKPRTKSKRTPKSQQPSGNQGGVSIGGNANIHNGDIAGRDLIIKGNSRSGNTTVNLAAREKLFKQVLKEIDKQPIPKVDKDDLKTNVKEIKEEAAKGPKADKSFLATRFRNIMRIAPDILKVVTATIANPAAGFALVVQKVAERAQADAGGAE